MQHKNQKHTYISITQNSENDVHLSQTISNKKEKKKGREDSKKKKRSV